MAKENVSHIFSYRYVCEHCGNVSEWADVSVSGKNADEIHNKKLPEVKNGVTRGDYISYLPLGAGKCKNCGKKQSWKLGKFTSRISLAFYLGVIIGALGSLILMSVNIGGLLWGVLGFVGGFVLGFPIGLIISIVDYMNTKSDIEKTANRFLPEIDWKDGT